jgi:flagellar biosynthesis protein FliR
MLLDLGKLVTAMLLIGARVTGLLMVAPVIGSNALPIRLKAGLALAITALLYPVYGSRLVSGAQALSLTLGIGEMLIGLLTGLVVTFVFDAAQVAGQILGFQIGYSLVNVIDPQSQVDTPVLGMFHQTIATLIFLRLNVHHWLLRGVANSFDYLPVASLLSASSVTRLLFHAAGSIWVAGIEIAAPALAATMLADVASGFLGKASPQLPLMMMQISIKAVLGLLVTAAALAFWPALFERYFTLAIAISERLLCLRA